MYTVMKTNDIIHTGSYSTAQLELDTHTRLFLRLGLFLNQLRPAHAWLLRIASVRECLYACVFVWVCMPQGYK